jgi:uncharacterized protein (TIGR02453 family)
VPPTIGEFTGFPPEAFGFYAELEDHGNNDRAWFETHREVYERCVRLPMESLLDRAAAEFGDESKVYRPHRDVRFSRDTTPYKTHCGAIISRRYAAPAVRYVQVDARGMVAAAGYPAMSRDQLQRFREAVDDGRTGGALMRAVAAARRAGLEVVGSELTRAPRGMSPQHPRVELLRHRRLLVRRAWPLAPWMHGAEAYERVAEVWRAAAPVGRWLERHVGAAREVPRSRGG